MENQNINNTYKIKEKTSIEETTDQKETRKKKASALKRIKYVLFTNIIGKVIIALIITPFIPFKGCYPTPCYPAEAICIAAIDCKTQSLITHIGRVGIFDKISISFLISAFIIFLITYLFVSIIFYLLSKIILKIRTK